MENLKEKVEAWIAKEGVPLEYYTSNAFRQQGFSTYQGEYIGDGNVMREIDVDAFQIFNLKGNYIRFHNIVECKWSKDKPWVVYTTHTKMNPSATINQSFGNITGEAFLWTLAGEEELQQLELFNNALETGYAGRQALGSLNDVFYSTLQSVVAKTLSKVNSYDGQSKQNPFDMVVLAFPVVVIDGALFETSYDAEKDKVLVKETKHCMVNWRGYQGWSYNARVHIVTKDYLSEFVSIRKQSFEKVLSYIVKYWDMLIECYDKQDLKYLEVKEASRGTIGLPKLFAEIRKQMSLKEQWDKIGKKLE